MPIRAQLDTFVTQNAGVLDIDEIHDELGLDDEDMPEVGGRDGRISGPTPEGQRGRQVRRTLRKRFSYRSGRVRAPNRLAKLVTLVEDTLKDGGKLRVVGAGRGMSNATDPVGTTAVSLHNLAGVISNADLGINHPAHPDRYVNALTGTPFCNVLRTLLYQDRAITNHGSGDFQSVGGALSTGTHGSGKAFTSIAGLARALWVVVVENGKVEVLCVQPTQGTFPGAQDMIRMTDGVQYRMVYDDDTFHAHLVGLGCLGLIYAVAFEVLTKIPWISETRTPIRLKTALADLDTELDVRHLELVVDPYPRSKTTTTPDAIIDDEAVTKVFDPARVRCQIVRRVEVQGVTHPSGNRPASMDMGRADLAAGIIGGQIRGMLREPVIKGPMGAQKMFTHSTIDKRPYVDLLPQILLLNLKYEGAGTEWAVPLPKLQQALKIILEDGLETYKALDHAADADAQIEILADRAVFYSGIAVRFVKGEQAWMAHTHELGTDGKPVPVWACIELGLLGSPGLVDRWQPRKRHQVIRPEVGVPPALVNYLLGRLKKKKARLPSSTAWLPASGCDAIGRENTEMHRRWVAYERGRLETLHRLTQALAPLGARPHPGLYHRQTWTEVEQRWPATADKWKQRYLAMKGGGIFENALTRQYRL